jgi:hypothetical protein
MQLTICVCIASTIPESRGTFRKPTRDYQGGFIGFSFNSIQHDTRRHFLYYMLAISGEIFLIFSTKVLSITFCCKHPSFPFLFFWQKEIQEAREQLDGKVVIFSDSSTS